MPESQCVLVCAFTDDVGTLDEGVHARDANDAHDDQADAADQQPRVLDCVRHGQDARPDVAFQEVDNRITVSENNKLTFKFCREF